LKKSWIRAKFKDGDVLARCQSDGALLVERGFVAFCYKPNGKVYSTRMDRIEPAEGAVPEIYGDPEVRAATPRPSSQIRPTSEAVQLWTDGACTGNPGPAGAGVLYRFKEDEQVLSEYLGQGTNNIAELTAILRGFEMVEDTSLPVDVMTDSSYCIGLLTKGWKAKANQELVASLRAKMAEFSDVRLVKVKGHAGIPENERADELAREAIVRSR
jgi:ribonuclease HI